MSPKPIRVEITGGTFTERQVLQNLIVRELEQRNIATDSRQLKMPGMTESVIDLLYKGMTVLFSRDLKKSEPKLEHKKKIDEKTWVGPSLKRHIRKSCRAHGCTMVMVRKDVRSGWRVDRVAHEQQCDFEHQHLPRVSHDAKSDLIDAINYAMATGAMTVPKIMPIDIEIPSLPPPQIAVADGDGELRWVEMEIKVDTTSVDDVKQKIRDEFTKTIAGQPVWRAPIFLDDEARASHDDCCICFGTRSLRCPRHGDK